MNQISMPASLRLCGKPATPAVTLRPMAMPAVADWEEFAGRCGASHHCALEHIRFWRIFRRIRFFDLFRTEGTSDIKIGQCAVVVGRRSHRFLDSLQMLPDHADCWPEAMAAVLAAVGPGTYHYGSPWNLECRRDQDLLGLTGVIIEHTEQMAVQAVDFGHWPCWDAYLRAVSTNARRNARKATQTHPDIRLTVHRGWAMFGQVRALTWLRRTVCQRKRLEFHTLREWLRAAMRAVIWRRHAFIATVEAEGTTHAMFSGIRFGGNTFYLEGASQADNDGAAWYLMLDMLRMGFTQGPDGHFVMGIAIEDACLSRSRQQCRVSDHPTSVIVFRYDGTEGGVRTG